MLDIKDYFGEKAVLDNNILSDFLEIENHFKDKCFHLINKVFKDVIIPKLIIDDEVIVEKNKFADLHYNPGILNTEIGFKTLYDLTNTDNCSLSIYDMHVIALCKQTGYMCITNDKPVRKTCEFYEINYTGTIGIIACAYENGIIKYKKLYNYIQFLFSEKSSCYLSKDLKTKILKYYFK
jgi:predicted nucleic acid-binding protein